MLVGVVAVVALIASVAAIALSGGGTPAAKKPAGGAATSPAAALPLLAPTGLSVQADAFSVTLTWSQPTSGAEVNVYKVYRDDVLVGTVGAPSTTFTDNSNVVPGKTYSYEVSSRGETLEESAPTSITVETPVPPLSAARVSGDFNVNVRVLSKSGFNSYPKKFTLAWGFEPKCDDGACQVVWNDLQTTSFKATFKRSGASYKGSDKGDFGSQCGKVSHNSSLIIRFKVTQAKAIEGEWRARKLVGTITQYDAPQLGCVTGRASMAFTATALS